jgi:F-type H+-transporting ATPase subunit b
MLIDWFTVAAQAVNFLILVGLLKRLLYRPVLAAIDAREKKIAAQLQSAAQREAHAQAEQDDFQRRSETLERDREGILRSAGKEREELGRRLVTQTQAEVFALTRQVLRDLAGVSLEQPMVTAFIENLRRLPKDTIGPAGGGAVRAALVRSAFDLSLPQRAAIKTAVSESLGADIAIRFESSSELICGIDLSVDGVKLAWSVADYLDSVSKQVFALIDPAQTSRTPTLEASHG